jgi:hypothetical protein
MIWQSTVGDASVIKFSHGLWGLDEESNSSDYRELTNLIKTLEEGLRAGQLVSSEVWIFNDNSLIDPCFGNVTLQATA